MIVDGQEIGGRRAYVLAELGTNHGGDLETAKKMIRVAAQAGVSAVKFQKRHNRTLFTKAFYNQPYSGENAYGHTIGEHREALEFGWDDYQALIEVAHQARVTLFATAFDQDSIDFCVRAGMPALKIASGDLTNLPLLAHAAQTKLPIFLSTGGGTLDDVRTALAVLAGSEVVILQCTAVYPCPPDLLDLRVIQTFQKAFPGHVVGASLHDNGIAMAVAAYALGARVIEQHFTLSRTMKGTDHPFSLEPQGLAKMVRDLRRAEAAMGDGIKKRHEAETPALTKMSKAIFAARPLEAGTRLGPHDLVCKSPGTGLPPSMLSEITGRVLTRDLKEEEAIGSSDTIAANLVPSH